MNDPHSLADSLLVHASFVQRLAHGLAGPDGDDLAQDTWAAALQQPPGGVHNLRAWFATIAANLWRNARRGAARRAQRERDVAAAGDEPSVADIVAREEVRRRVVGAVLTLPDRLRSVVLRRYFEGLDAATIARRHGVPPSTVRSQLRDALAVLRQRLDREHGDSRAAWIAPLAAWRPKAALAPVAAVLRVTWPVRASIGVAIAALAMFVVFLAPDWNGPPPTPLPTATTQVARTDEANAQPAAATPDREGATAAAVAVADAHGPEDIWGRVLAAEDGRAIAGAEITLTHQPFDEVSKVVLMLAGEPPTVLGTTHSGDDGTFSFRVRRALQHRLIVRAGGFAVSRLPACTGGSEVIVSLARPATIEGSVRLRDGTPVADALVRASERSGAGELASTRTAGDGTFVLNDLPPVSIAVSSRPAGFPRSPWQRVDAEAGVRHRVDLVVEPGRRVTGVVRDAGTNVPIAGARIADSYTMRDAVETAADGSFVLNGVGEGADVEVRADGYVPRVLGVRSPGEVSLDILLQRGASIAGRIVDHEGRARPDAIVVVARTSLLTEDLQARTLPAPVDANGRFRSDGIGGAKELWLSLGVHAAGCATHWRMLPMERMVAGQLLDLGDVILEAPALLEGRAADSSGRPIADARIELAPRGGTGHVPSLAQRSTRTAADGMFRFASLETGKYALEASIDQANMPVPSGPHAIVAGEVHRVDITVDLGLAISGRLIVRGRHEPPNGNEVSLYAMDDRSTHRYRQATIAKDGTFRVERLAPGKHRLAAVDTPPGFVMAPRYDVEAGSTDVQLELVPAEVIEGRVLDKDGKPIAGINVNLFLPDVMLGRGCRSDAQGRFRLEIAPGVLGKLIAQDGTNLFRQATADNVLPGTRDVELRLP